jgi:hypothetical protein
MHYQGYGNFSLMTVLRAERLLAIAEEHEEDSDPLLGCSILLLAAALDQSLMTTFKSLILEYEANEQWDLSKQVAALQDTSLSSLWYRLKKTPELLRVNPFKLNSRSETVCFLRDVVTRRNNLTHIEQDPISFEIDFPSIDEIPSKITYQLTKEEQNELFKGTAWKQVTIAEVRRGIKAVKVYLHALAGDPIGEVELLTCITV